MAVSSRTPSSQTSNIMKQFTTEQLRNELAERGFQKENKLIAEFMENIKDNKLIAEFMGSNLNGLESWQYEEELQYHTSWDWLMPVVERIESEGYTFEKNKQSEGDWQCLIVRGYDIVYQEFADLSIDATYRAVVRFINDKIRNRERK